MHILLTDVLVCPRCGPGFGLILLADEIGERRVNRGWLGCSNCRERSPVTGGTVWFASPFSGQEEGEGAGAEADGVVSPVKVAALLGVSPPGYVLLLGEAGAMAIEVAGLVEGVEVIVMVGERPEGALAGATRGSAAGEAGRGEWGVSRVVVHPGLNQIPIATGKMSGVALTGPDTDRWLEEAARVVRATGRLLVDPAPDRARERLSQIGLRVLAEEGSTLLAVRG